jgi:Na+-transporting NADH:ubiquinone oxidoreductase subunit NqrB
LFANPASSIESFFYFGFLAERLSHKTGRWLTPLLIGLMYSVHEMTNPEYWYEGMNFWLVFVGVAITAAIYLWRRNVVVIWLGSGLGRKVSRLF